VPVHAAFFQWKLRRRMTFFLTATGPWGAEGAADARAGDSSSEKTRDLTKSGAKFRGFAWGDITVTQPASLYSQTTRK
jgi:hypothetical protein